MTNDKLPLTTDANPKEATRRFRILNDNGEIDAHGAIYPPPTCCSHLVFKDGHTELHDGLGEILDQHGENLVWVDSAGFD